MSAAWQQLLLLVGKIATHLTPWERHVRMSVSGAAAYEYAGGHRAGLISWGSARQVLPGLGSRRRPGAGLGLAGLVVVLVGLDQGVEDPGQVFDIAGGQGLDEIAALGTTSAPQWPGSGCARSSAFSSAYAASNRSTGTAATASRAGGTPSFCAR
jgi:hypothetical protein